MHRIEVREDTPLLAATEIVDLLQGVRIPDREIMVPEESGFQYIFPRTLYRIQEGIEPYEAEEIFKALRSAKSRLEMFAIRSGSFPCFCEQFDELWEALKSPRSASTASRHTHIAA